jgi:3-isopropylmalate/(R)-2-methylmalate dehydratase large subunit
MLSEEKRKMGLLDLATQLKLKQQDFAKVQGIKLHGELRDRKGSEGICHSVMLETYALPGQVNVGSDSHTPHVRAIGCIAFGIGTTDVFNAWITKDVRVKVPRECPHGRTRWSSVHRTEIFRAAAVPGRCTLRVL